MLAWASTFVAIRAVGADLSPGPLALGRLLVGTAVLGALLGVTGRPWVAPTRSPARTAMRIGPTLTSIAVVPASRCCSAALSATV